MTTQNKKFHIFLSFFLIFLPYILLFGLLKNILHRSESYIQCIMACYEGIYSFFINGLINAKEYYDFYQVDIKYFIPTLIGIIYLYLSIKVTYNFWKNQTKHNKYCLYFVNSILLSPLGVIITYMILAISYYLITLMK